MSVHEPIETTALTGHLLLVRSPEFLLLKLEVKMKKRRARWSLFRTPIRHPVRKLTMCRATPIIEN